MLEERLHFAERSTALGRLASARKTEFDSILSNVKGEISRLNRLVGEFLSFGRPMRLHPQEYAVDVLLREVGALVDHKARDQGIALSVQAEEGLPRVIADPELLKTCFLNLMINGLDAMPEGGRLTASVRRETGGAGGLLRVEVSDDGRGMSAQEVREAFEPYFSTKETGLGIGLALTRKIVSDHGGSIELRSEPGRGTTAALLLPLAAGAALAS